MKAEDLKEGALLQSRTTKATREVRGFQPATGKEVRLWLVNDNWLNLAQLDARYRVAGKKKAPKRKSTSIV